MSIRTNANSESPGAGDLRDIAWTLLIVALVLLLALPLSGQTKKAARKDPILQSLVWPQPPQEARVRYVSQILTVEDVLGKQSKRSWMNRLAGVKEEEPQTKLLKPYGIGADSRGRIYVADAANRIVFVFDLDTKKVDFRGNRAPARLALPIGIALDNSDRLFVSDSHFHQIVCYSPEGELLAVFGDRELKRPGGLAIDNQRRRLYVADTKGNRIAVFNADSFAFVEYLGSASAPGEAEVGKFSAPTNVAVDEQGLLYVTDTWNYRVQVLQSNGKFVRAMGEQGVQPGYFLRPKGIAVDPSGNLIVADAEFNNFQILSPEGQPLLAVGSYGYDPGQFILIAGVAADKRNRIYTTEQLQGRVQIFELIPVPASPAKPATP